MRLKFNYVYLWIMPIALAVFMNYAFAVTSSKSDTTYLHLRSKSKNTFKNGLHLVLPPLKPAYISNTRLNVARPDDKLLNEVQIYPNPVTDQINIKYDLSRGSSVSIKLMDVLGNEIVPLFSQRIDPGEKVFSYALNGKLTRGFYFIRIVAGTESVIKRISVL